MPPAERSAVDDRTAIRAVAVAFAVNGIAFPSLLPRFPQIAEQVGASEAAFGLALAGGSVGGLIGGIAAPVIAARVGLVRTTLLAGVVLAAAAVAVGIAPTVPLLAVALGLMGFADAGHDISMNEVALGEQARRPSSVMGRLHGVWSIGSTGAAAVGAAAAALQVPVVVHLAAVGLLSIGLQVWSGRRLRDRDDGVDRDDAGDGVDVADQLAVPPSPSLSSATPTPVRLRRWPVMTVLTLAAVGAILAEGTGLDWTALALRRGLDASPGVAGLGPLVFSAGILAGRAVTDPLVDRLGPGPVLVLANGLTAVATTAGMVVAGATGSPWPLLVALFPGGIGVAANFPMLFGAGDRVATRLRLPAGTGSSVVGTLPRAGNLIVPAAIGGVAQAAGLLTALTAMIVGAILVAFLLPRIVEEPTASG